MAGQPQSSGKRRFRILALTLLIVVVLGGLAVGGHKVRKRMMIQSALTEGTAAFEKGDWDTARRMLGRYVSVHPEDTAVLVKYAEAQLAMRPLQQEHIGQASGAYRRIFNDNAADERAFRRLVLLYESAGSYADLGFVAAQRLERLPDDPAAVIAQAKDLIVRQKPADAQAALQRLIDTMTAAGRFGADYVEACVLSAGALRLAGKAGYAEAALQVLTQAAEREPQCALALVQRAALQRELTQASAAAGTAPPISAAARADLERAELLAAQDPRVLLGLAREWLAQREFARTRACLDAARQLDEGCVQQYLLNPADWTAARFEVAAGLALAGRELAAGVSLTERTLEELKDMPQRTQLLPIAVELLLAGGRSDSADQLLHEYSDALERLPNMPDRAERLAYLRALVARARGETYAVINLLEPLVNSANAPFAAQALLAEAYARTGQHGRMAKLLAEDVQTGELGPVARKALARWKAQHGAWAEAVALLLPLEQADPPDIEARVMRLSAELNTIDAQDTARQQLSALKQAASALREQYPQRVDVRLLLAAIADRQNAAAEAVAELERATTECDDPITAALALARLYRGHNQPDEAQALLTRLCEQNGATAAPWLALSELLVDQKQTAAARDALQRGMAAVAPPDKRQLMLRRATLELVDGDRTAGIDELTRVAREDASDVRSRTMLLELPEILQNAALAQQLIDEIKAAEGDAGLRWRYQQARLWLAASTWRGQRQQIEDLLKYCTDADPQWSAAPLVLGGMYEQLAEWSQAERTYANGFRATSDVSLADRWLAVLQHERRFDEARDVLERLRKVLDERTLAARRIDLALGARQYDQALSELELRATADQRDPRDLLRLAELTYLQSHNAPRALEYLEQAAQLGAVPAALARSRVAILSGEGRQDEAVAVLDDLIAAQPTPESYLLRASYYAGTGRSELAERDFAAISNLSRDAFGPAALGEFYARGGRLDEAIAAWEEGLQNYPESDMLKRGLTKARLLRNAAGDGERIAQLLTDLESRLPDDTELLWLRAMDQMRSGESRALQAVREALPKALTSPPAKAEVYRGLARIATQLEDYAAARDLLQRGLQVNPGDADLQVLRAWTELDLNNLAEARRIAERLTAEAGTVPGWEVFVECARRQGDRRALARAAAALAPLVREQPTDERLQLIRAQALAESGDNAGAEAALQDYRQSAAGRQSLPVTLALAELALARSDFGAAEQWINAAAELNADRPAVARARLHLLAARKDLDAIVQFATGLPKDNHDWAPDVLVSAALALSSSPAHLKTAVELCQHAAELAPDAVPAHLALADLLYRAGDPAAAMQEYRRALQINPAHPDGLNNLAWVLAEQGSNYDEALHLSQQAVALQPGNANFRDTLAFVLQQMPNRLPQARQELQQVVDLSEPGSVLRARSLRRLAQVCDKLNDRKPIPGYLHEALTIFKARPEAFSPAEQAEIERLLQAVSTASIQ